MHMKLSLLFVILTLSLALPLRAEPDKLLRTLLGVSSLPVRFIPSNDDQVYQFAIAKFKDGKFVGYCALAGGADVLHAASKASAYEAELAWTKHEGQDGFLVRTPDWTQNFMPDAFFGNALYLTCYFAYDRSPQTKLGPFSVLGVAVGGSGGKPPANEQNAAEWIKRYPYAVVFLLMPCANVEQAENFAESHASTLRRVAGPNRTFQVMIRGRGVLFVSHVRLTPGCT